jgi:hypothetical protein
MSYLSSTPRFSTHKNRARRSSLNEDELDSGSLLAPGKPLVKKKSLSLDLRQPDYENFIENDDFDHAANRILNLDNSTRSADLEELFAL